MSWLNSSCFFQLSVEWQDAHVCRENFSVCGEAWQGVQSAYALVEKLTGASFAVDAMEVWHFEHPTVRWLPESMNFVFA